MTGAFLVRYQAEDGLRDIYFDTYGEALEWARSHDGSEIWKLMRRHK